MYIYIYIYGGPFKGPIVRDHETNLRLTYCYRSHHWNTHHDVALQEARPTLLVTDLVALQVSLRGFKSSDARNALGAMIFAVECVLMQLVVSVFCCCCCLGSLTLRA